MTPKNWMLLAALGAGLLWLLKKAPASSGVGAAVMSVGDVFTEQVQAVQGGAAMSTDGNPDTRTGAYLTNKGRTLYRTAEKDAARCVGFSEYYNGVLYCPRA